MAEKLEKVDVVIAGAGWAGGIVAAELSKQGYNVIALERGKDQKTEDFIGAKVELRYWSRGDIMQDLTKETLTSRNHSDERALPVRSNENVIIGNGTGGSGMHWNGFVYRFLPYDFEIYDKTVEKYGKNRIPEGMTIQNWGITYDELEPYYDKFEKTIGVSGERSPLGPERSNDYPNPPMAETPALRLFKDAAEELGYHPYQQPSANMSQQYENPDGETMNACVYCSFCERYGCDFGAKASPNVTVIKTAEKSGNFELRNHSYVTRVLHNGERATGLLYVDTQTGLEYEQPADIVVLAGFVFTNTRLLLLSEIGEPYDPESGTGIIGKNFTGHFGSVTYGGARGYFEDKKFNTFAGAGALGAIIDDFNGDNIDNTDLDFLHGFEVHIKQHGAGPISQDFQVPEGTAAWGEEFKKNLLHYANRTLYNISKLRVERCHGITIIWTWILPIKMLSVIHYFV